MMNVEQVCAAAVSAQLLTTEQAAQHAQAWQAREGAAADGTGFVQSLVSEHQFTDFQAAALLSGIPGPYMLGPYRVSARLTAGRLGDVYRAEHAEFNQPVALKIFPATLSRNRERLARLGREARVGLQVDHLNVVKTFQVGKVGEIPFIALEELSGEALEQRLERDGRLPYAEACELIQQAARGLAYLHSEDIVHRDICPANLWITTHGLVKILEFGAARDALSFLDSLEGDEDELTVNMGGQTGGVLGRYDYMSSQQAQDPHSANVASDLYSLGCTLYHCLTGQVPFPDRNPVRQMLRHANETPRVLFDFDQEIPESVQEIVSKLLAKLPSDRFDSAEEAAERLAEVVPPKTLPELDPVNAEFLEWLRTGQNDAQAGELQDVGYEPEFQEFLEFVSESRFEAVMSQRPTF